MAKLYPPLIAGTIPAFYGTSIEVPFSMNRAVSPVEIGGFVLKIKKVNGAVIGTAEMAGYRQPAVFDISAFKLQVGQYYKIQLAYYAQPDKTVGYFSTIGVVKYTTRPEVIIEGLNRLTSNNHNYIYTGICRQATLNKDGTYDTKGYDTSEKLYSSRFYFYDENKKLLKDSGDIIHSINRDISPYEANEEFQINEDLDLEKQYYIQYKVTTSNGMVVSSPKYIINQKRQRPMILDAHLEVANDFDNGTVKVNLVSNHFPESIFSGMFLLSRSSDREPNKWEPMKYFSLQSEYPTKLLYVDYTVEQGLTYTYSLQQYNENNIYSEREYSNSVKVDFEDLFLYDGERQLNVRFNPKVATYKENHVEQKQDTIGSKHPFIIRNGVVNYKEFSISGLISYQIDKMSDFLPKDFTGMPRNPYDGSFYTDYNLVTDNIKAERIFKNEVLSWLNNGKTKLFRSPTEGNYIVRLMNISLSPNDTLGRMLHTFNSTAYEMADCTYENLIAYGILDDLDKTNQILRWKTIDLAKETDLAWRARGEAPEYAKLNHGKNLGIDVTLPVYQIDFQGLQPGSYFLAGADEATAQKIFIGATGAYHLKSEEPINYLAIPLTIDGNRIYWQGQLNFGYKGWVKSPFDLLTSVNIITEPGKRFYGDAYKATGKDNIIEYLENVKKSILSVKYIRLHSRVIKPLYREKIGNTTYYYTNEIDAIHGGHGYKYTELKDILDPWCIYKIYVMRKEYYDVNGEDYYLDHNDRGTVPEKTKTSNKFIYFDLMQAEWRRMNNYTLSSVNNYLIYANKDEDLYNTTINGETINLFDIQQQEYRGLGEIKDISISPGVILDLGYIYQNSTYNFEKEDPDIAMKKDAYEKALENFLKLTKNNSEKKSFYSRESTFQTMKQAEKEFIDALTYRVERYREDNGVGE